MEGDSADFLTLFPERENPNLPLFSDGVGVTILADFGVFDGWRDDTDEVDDGGRGMAVPVLTNFVGRVGDNLVAEDGDVIVLGFEGVTGGDVTLIELTLVLRAAL